MTPGAGPVDRIPVLLLTGGLGSGKTTLLSAWLGQPALANAALVVNEIGEVGLDDHLLRPRLQATEASALVARACVCCTGLPGLEEALADLYRARLERRIARFDRVVIETTGLAEPQPVVAAFARDPLLRERFRLEGVVTTVAATAPEALQARAELRAQVAGADLLVVTKADRVDCARLAASFQRLQLQQPRARVMASAQGDLPVAQVLEAFEPLQGLGAASPTGDAQGPRAAHADHGHHGEGHVHDAIARFLPLPRPFARADLMRRLQRGLARAGGRLMRLKGVVLAEDGGAVAVQWAPGDEIPVLAPGSGPLPEPGLTAIAADSGALQDLAQALGA